MTNRSIHLPLLTLALGLGTFIQVLDGSIANVCIPNIAADLGVSPREGVWVITSFSVSNAIVLPLTGWLANRFGSVRLFSLSTLLFGFFSACCALSYDYTALIISRILQGAVAGSLIPLSQGLLVMHYPPEKKGIALSIWGMIVIVAPILGPIAGGWITDNYGWPWVFYINIPIALLSAALSWSLLKDHETPRQRLPIDLVGFFLLSIGIASLQITFDKGHDLDWFSSPFIQALAATACASLIYFFIWERGQPNPIVDLSFFKIRNYSLGVLLSTLAYTLIFGTMVLFPLFLEQNLDYTPYLSGLAIAPIGILPFFLTPLIGRWLLKVDLRYLVTLSFASLGATFLWFTHFNTAISFEDICLSRLIQGFGNAFFFIPLFTLAIADVPKEKVSSASGIYNGIRLLIGGGLGTSLFTTLWNNWQAIYLTLYREKMNPFNPAYKNARTLYESLSFKGATADALIEGAISRQASMLGLNDIFLLSAILFFASIPLIWLMKNTLQSQPANNAGE
ncbi:MAG: hypothetical protein K0S07_436 [Chlamydiales bacterium]|nr:hypothetical protein [Chlamydiales bacterium]